MTPLETAIQAARKTEDFTSAWNLLVNTEVFVGVHTNEQDSTKNFRFDVIAMKGLPVLVAAENVERLKNPRTEKAIKMRGAALIGMLNPEVGLVLAVNPEPLAMPAELVQWLKASIQPA